MSKEYMEILLDVVDDVLQDESEFDKAKMLSQKIAKTLKKQVLQ